MCRAMHPLKMYYGSFSYFFIIIINKYYGFEWKILILCYIHLLFLYVLLYHEIFVQTKENIKKF